jgi:diguanylate cyclase (GGDEF)-like protein
MKIYQLFKSTRKKIIDVSLRVKLLGIYFMGLTLLGFIGYGFFIRMEMRNYQEDKKQFHEQTKFFEKESFDQLKYTLYLRNQIKNLYRGDTTSGKTGQSVLREFVQGIVFVNENNLHFAIVDAKGNQLASNFKKIEHLLRKNSENYNRIVECIQQAADSDIASTYLTFYEDEKPFRLFAIATPIEPANLFFLSFNQHQQTNRYIATILDSKKKNIISAVILSLMIGFVATLFVILVLFFYLKSVTKNINSITSCIKALISAEAKDMQLNAQNSDEIGRMISAFNIYLQKKLNLEKFKQLIEEDSNIHDVYSRVFQLMESLDIKRFAVYEVSHEKNCMMYVNPQIQNGTHTTISSMPCSDEILVDPEICRANRLAQIVNGNNKYVACPKFLGYQEGHGHMCIPIFIGGTVGNIVHVSIPKGKEKEFEDIAPVVMEYLKNASPVIESKQLLQSLKETTFRDCLTGLNNRRFLEEYTNIISAETQRYSLQNAILMCDLDHFKSVNDTYDHEAGDKALAHVAGIIKSSLRGSDIVVRYGGEEFLVVLKDVKDANASLEVAEKIRENIEKEEIEIAQETILQITISIGVAFYPLDSNNFWEVVRLADKALYNAKETGRNRVSCLKSAAKEHPEIDMPATINSDTAKSLPEAENFDSKPS